MRLWRSTSKMDNEDKAGIVVLFILLPLATWKLVDVVVFLCHHLTWV